MTDPTERWRPVKNFEGFYEVSNLGRVRSVDRTVTSRNRWGPIEKHLRGKILSQATGSYGYLVVTMSRDGRERPYRVHLLVGEAFLGPRPPGHDIRHGPRGRQANAAADLCYGTRAENEQDKIRDGTFRHGGDGRAGEAANHVKLTWAIAREIRRRRAAGERPSALAREFNTTPSTVYYIASNRQWKAEHDPQG